MRWSILLLAILAVLAAGCGGNDEEAVDDVTQPAATSEEGATKGVIGVSYPTVEGPWFTAVLYGMSEEAAERGYELVIVNAGGYENVDTQVSQMADLVQREVDGILTAVADPEALAPQIQAASDAGIPVVAAGEEGQNVVASVSASHCTLGEEMAEGVKELLPDGGKIAALTGPAGAFWTVSRWDCFQAALEGANIEVVDQQWSEPSVDEGLRLAEDILQRNPDLDLFYGVDDTVGVGAAQAVKQGPGCDSVQIVTAILGPTAEELLREGCIDYLVAQQTVNIGRDSVATLVEAIEGGSVEENVEVPNVVVTPDTIESLDKAGIQPPEGWRPDVR